MKELQRFQAWPDNSILMVIDIDNETGKGPEGPVGPIEHISTKEMIIPKVRKLIDQAHEVGVQVIYIQSVRTHLEPQFTVFDYHHMTRKIGTRASAIVDELTPESRDIVVRKWYHDPWFETDLERVLTGLVPDPTRCQALITGGAGTGCAFFGFNGFYVRNFQTVIVMDAVYGGPMIAAAHFSRTNYPTYPNVFLTKAELIEFSKSPEPVPAGD